MGMGLSLLRLSIAQGIGYRVQLLNMGLSLLRLSIVQGIGYRVQGIGYRVQGKGYRVCGIGIGLFLLRLSIVLVQGWVYGKVENGFIFHMFKVKFLNMGFPLQLLISVVLLITLVTLVTLFTLITMVTLPHLSYHPHHPGHPADCLFPSLSWSPWYSKSLIVRWIVECMKGCNLVCVHLWGRGLSLQQLKFQCHCQKECPINGGIHLG